MFIRTNSDKDFAKEKDTHDADSDEIEEMWEQVSSALTKGSTPADIKSSISSNAINEFMNPVSRKLSGFPSNSLETKRIFHNSKTS